jgi:hypothetical protein
MSLRCISKDVVLAGTGRLQLPSAWTSNKPAGELARFEVRLSPEGPFRFLVKGVQTTVVKAKQRKVTAGAAVEISTDYINLSPGPNKRMARFTFCGITTDDVEVASERVKFLP